MVCYIIMYYNIIKIKGAVRRVAHAHYDTLRSYKT